MTSMLSEKSKAVIRVVLDMIMTAEGQDMPGSKTKTIIRDAHNEVGYPNNRESVLYEKLIREWKE